ncbi:MAG: hypothetical protein WD045_11160, partial [Pirellulaceae bacterium]
PHCRFSDERGRWIDTFKGEPLVGDQKFQSGDRYLSSETFSRNLETLAGYCMSPLPGLREGLMAPERR